MFKTFDRMCVGGSFERTHGLDESKESAAAEAAAAAAISPNVRRYVPCPFVRPFVVDIYGFPFGVSQERCVLALLVVLLLCCVHSVSGRC